MTANEFAKLYAGEATAHEKASVTLTKSVNALMELADDKGVTLATAGDVKKFAFTTLQEAGKYRGIEYKDAVNVEHTSYMPGIKRISDKWRAMFGATSAPKEQTAETALKMIQTLGDKHSIWAEIATLARKNLEMV